MEPCSKRSVGNTPCVERILKTGIQHVFIGVKEPGDFVQCEGIQLLKDNGRKVWLVIDPDDPSLGEECLKVARGQQ
jgi:pyrimidine deaminase RibD-like protein